MARIKRCILQVGLTLQLGNVNNRKKLLISLVSIAGQNSERVRRMERRFIHFPGLLETTQFSQNTTPSSAPLCGACHNSIIFLLFSGLLYGSGMMPSSFWPLSHRFFTRPFSFLLAYFLLDLVASGIAPSQATCQTRIPGRRLFNSHSLSPIDRFRGYLNCSDPVVELYHRPANRFFSRGKKES